MGIQSRKTIQVAVSFSNQSYLPYRDIGFTLEDKKVTFAANNFISANRLSLLKFTVFNEWLHISPVLSFHSLILKLESFFKD